LFDSSLTRQGFWRAAFRRIQEVLAPQRFFDSLNLTTPLILSTKIKGPIGFSKGRFNPNRTVRGSTLFDRLIRIEISTLIGLKLSVLRCRHIAH